MTDLRDWLTQVDRIGELKIVRGADPETDIGPLTEINDRRRGSALLFDEIKGYEKGYRLLTSALINSRRLGIALGVEGATTAKELLTKLEERSSEWEAQATQYRPKEVESGPILENALVGDKVDMLKFPAPLWNELDGGRYLGTGDIVITQDPEDGTINVGTYRVMVQDRQKLGIYISPTHHGARHLKMYHSQGKPCPVAISFGHDPILLAVGGSALPYGVHEYDYAGSMRKSPIEVIRGPVTGLPIPATSEVAIEGFIPPGKYLPEGPFGEYTGYYASGRRDAPFIEISAVYHRNDPIVLGAHNCKTPHDYSFMACVLKSVIVKDALAKAGVPQVKGVWFHEASAVNFLLVVSIKQLYSGHPTQAGTVAAQSQVAATSNGRYIIVVDDDIDPTNLEEVVWALGTRSDPETSIDILRRTYRNRLDPMLPEGAKDLHGSRAVIDACRPFARLKEFPKVATARPEVQERVKQKWAEILPTG